MLAAVSVVLITTARLLGPWNILDNDQLRPHSYVQDIIRNDNWLVQHDWTGEVASKPPLYAWIASIPALITNHVGPLELAIPSMIGVLIASITIAMWVSRKIGARTACTAVLAFVCTPLMIKQVTLARTDALYAGLTTLAAVLAFRAWTTRKGWWEFWLVAGLATLTKGPLAIVLALAGLLFIRNHRPPRTESRSRECFEHALGIILFLALAAGWFIAAWLNEGQPFIDKVLGRELFGHITGASEVHTNSVSAFDTLFNWLLGLFQPTLYLLYHAAPWSIFAFLAIVHAYRQPSDDPDRRAYEPFCAGWLIIGLAIFSVVPHQRPDLLSPIWAPGAIMAASMLTSLVGTWSRRRARLAAAATTLVALVIVLAIHYHTVRTADFTIRRNEIRAAFDEMAAQHIPPTMITPIDGPYLFTAYCNTLPARVTEEQAILLLSGNAPAFVSTNRPEALIAAVRDATGGRPAFALVRSDQVAVVSNTRELRDSDSVAMRFNDLLIETAGCRLLPSRLGVLTIATKSDHPAVIAIRNLSESTRSIEWRTTTAERGRVEIAPLAESIVTIPTRDAP